MEWALILFFYAGAFSGSDSNSTTTVHGFATAELCERAKVRAVQLARGLKEGDGVCVRVK